MTMEYLVDDRPRRPLWQLVAAGICATVLLVIAAGAWWSAQVRERANAQLSAALTRADGDARAGEAVVLSMLQYSSPAIWSTMVGEDVRAGLRALVQRSAAEVVRTLDASRSAADSTLVLPWDGTQRQAKEAVLAAVDAQRERFTRIAADATAIGAAFAGPAPSVDEARALLRASGANVPAAP